MIRETFVSQHKSDWALINEAAENNPHLNITSLYILGLETSSPGVYDMEKRNLAKMRNFSDLEIETLTSQVQLNQLVLLGSLKSGIKGSWKNAVWNEITAAVNSVAMVNLNSS